MRSRFRLALVAGSCGLLACGTAPDVTGTGGAPPAAQHATAGPSHKPGAGGGGAPITIPNFIIKIGDPIYDLKSEIEAAALTACGYRCVTVEVDTSHGQCLRDYTSDPPLRMVDPSEASSDYIVQRGTRITLLGQEECSSPEASPS